MPFFLERTYARQVIHHCHGQTKQNCSQMSKFVKGYLILLGDKNFIPRITEIILHVYDEAN